MPGPHVNSPSGGGPATRWPGSSRQARSRRPGKRPGKATRRKGRTGATQTTREPAGHGAKTDRPEAGKRSTPTQERQPGLEHTRPVKLKQAQNATAEAGHANKQASRDASRKVRDPPRQVGSTVRDDAYNRQPTQRCSNVRDVGNNREDPTDEDGLPRRRRKTQPPRSEVTTDSNRADAPEIAPSGTMRDGLEPCRSAR